MNPNHDSMSRLEADLRRNRPLSQPPADLHETIVRAVRAAGDAPVQPTATLRWRWLMAAAAASLVVLCAWRWPFSQSPAGPHPLAAVTATLETTQAMPQQASAAVLSPLAQELEFLNRDIRNAVDVLVASVP